MDGFYSILLPYTIGNKDNYFIISKTDHRLAFEHWWKCSQSKKKGTVREKWHVK